MYNVQQRSLSFSVQDNLDFIRLHAAWQVQCMNRVRGNADSVLVVKKVSIKEILPSLKVI